MIGWSGRRKALTLLLFIAPTLLGLLMFSVFPFIFNVFISTSNRGQFHPNPDCSQPVWRIIEPTCWLGKEATGLGSPFGFIEPIYKNYADLIGGLFTGSAVLGVIRLLAILGMPIAGAIIVNRRLDRQLTRPLSTTVVWLIALVAAVLLALLLDFNGAVAALMKGGDFIVVNARTILYVAVCIPLFFLVGLAMALVLNLPYLRGKTFFRVVLIVPWAASTVAIMMSLIWQFFFRGEGTINQLLRNIGIEGPTYLNDGVWAFVVVVIVNLWYTYPFFMVVILGGLQSIPPEQYEAAEVDGASWWTQLTRITLPLLRPAVLPAMVLSALTTYKVDSLVYAITRGGPTRGAGQPGATDMVMVYAYKQIFNTNAYGRMGAFAVILFIMLFIATLYSLRITRITKGAYE